MQRTDINHTIDTSGNNDVIAIVINKVCRFAGSALQNRHRWIQRRRGETSNIRLARARRRSARLSLDHARPPMRPVVNVCSVKKMITNM